MASHRGADDFTCRGRGWQSSALRRRRMQMPVRCRRWHSSEGRDYDRRVSNGPAPAIPVAKRTRPAGLASPCAFCGRGSRWPRFSFCSASALELDRLEDRGAGVRTNGAEDLEVSRPACRRTKRRWRLVAWPSVGVVAVGRPGKRGAGRIFTPRRSLIRP
jgi:hypothetical protein